MTRAPAGSAAALEVRGLHVGYPGAGGTTHAVRGVSFAIRPGEAYGLIGESGSGKTTVAYAVMRHLAGAEVRAERIALGAVDMGALDARALQRLRGARIAMVYQNPMSALNPVIRVGEQIAEAIRQHEGAGRKAAWDRAVRLLDRVHLPDPAAIARRYPHQLSGGQQQRVVIAMAIACDPSVLIMDEPTTGLDVTTEAVILDLVRELRAELGAAVLFISHNLAVVGELCDRVGVLYAGELMEEGATADVLGRPRHPYTQRLLAAVPGRSRTALRAIPGTLPDLRTVPEGCIFRPRCEQAEDVCRTRPDLAAAGPEQASRCHFRDRPRPVLAAASSADDGEAAALGGAAPPRLVVEDLSKSFAGTGGIPLLRPAAPVQAVRGVSLAIAPGRTLGLVGESGSGKSTLARCVAGLTPFENGTLRLDGDPLAPRVGRRPRQAQEAIQVVFQNPEAALNPHHTVEEIVGRPLALYRRCARRDRRRRVLELLAAVKLGERVLGRYPAQLSGGEKQRVAIARAFASGPALVICDEPTSALDISVQAAVLTELKELQRRFGTSYLFISHDIGVVRHVADEVAVLYLGTVVEVGRPAAVFAAPHHPYTEALAAAVPSLDGQAREPIRLSGPRGAPGRGCIFQGRCPRRIGPICDREAPPWREDGAGHRLACHHTLDALRALQSSATARGAAAPARAAAP